MNYTKEGGMKKRCVVFYSGGIASWCAAKRIVESGQYESVELLFTDTKMEDEDVYRFLHEGAEALGLEVTILADGRDVWEVFWDVRFLGNSRVDPCSRILKRELAKKWVHENTDPEDTDLCFGIDFFESHRTESISRNWQPWRCVYPLMQSPWINKDDMLRQAREMGVEPPDMYRKGYAHANCGGFCIKGGHGHFATLLKNHPERYAYHERKEAEFREEFGDVAILRDRKGGESRPMTLAELRERIEAGDDQINLFDVQGCGCFVDVDE